MMNVLAFFRPGFWELVVILLIVLVLFGAARLPGIGKAVGEAVRGFKKASSDEKKPRDSSCCGENKSASGE